MAVMGATFALPLDAGRAWADETSATPPDLPPPAGGPFSLTDHRGRTVTDEDFLGSYLLVFFGYTYCPDVCPTGLQILSEAVAILDAAGKTVQPVLLTVDPERDTWEVLADYVAVFHPRLVGLTGTPKEIKAVARSYGARYFKLYDPPFSDDEEEGDGAEELGYTVNHSAYTYLLGPDGRGLATFAHGTWPQDMAEGVRRFMDD
jgi:protein SCO1/2